MKVADFMHKPLITISETEPVKKVLKFIFNLGISGVPVVRGKQLIGMITEQDILSRLFPTIKEFMEDYIESRDFEVMEDRLKLIMHKPVKEIMNPKVRSVTPATPLMKAQSLILVNNFSRLPVVNEKKELVGIVSQGDIFKTTMTPRNSGTGFLDTMTSLKRGIDA